MKMSRIQVFIIYLCLIAPMAKGQQNPASDQVGSVAQSVSARQLMVQWDAGSFQVSQNWATALNSKYQEKIVQVNLIPLANNSIMVHFRDGKVREEDLLQVMEMEGIPSPYFISNGRKYLLGDNKTLVNEPVK